MNAAFAEFANQGYQKASTNAITQNAGISKGMLFYYFNSKEELYHDLVDQGIAFICDAYLSKIDDTEPDFIERYRRAAEIKAAALREHPDTFHFFSSLYLQRDSAHLTNHTIEQLERIRVQGLERMYANVDTSRFRQDIPGEAVIEMIRCCMDGYEKRLTEQLSGEPMPEFSDRRYWDAFYLFLGRLRTVFYQPR